MAIEMQTELYIKRVPSKDNLADDPSRERYGLLELMKASTQGSTCQLESNSICMLQARPVFPILDDRFTNAQAWKSLSVTAQNQWIKRNDPTEMNAIALD